MHVRVSELWEAASASISAAPAACSWLQLKPPSNSPLSSDRANCTNCNLPDVTTVTRVFWNGQSFVPLGGARIHRAICQDSLLLSLVHLPEAGGSLNC